MLLFLALGFGFSGYLLPWNELSYFATKVGTDVPAQIPGIGPLLSRILRGGSDVTGATLSRFYGIHVAILPAITTVDPRPAPSPRAAEGHERSPVDREAGPEADDALRPGLPPPGRDRMADGRGTPRGAGRVPPVGAGTQGRSLRAAPAGIRPEWYFLWMFQALKYLPAEIAGIPGETLGVLFFSVLAVLLVAVPLLDRGAARGRPSRLWNAAAVLSLIGALILTVLALLPHGKVKP